MRRSSIAILLFVLLAVVNLAAAPALHEHGGTSDHACLLCQTGRAGLPAVERIVVGAPEFAVCDCGPEPVRFVPRFAPDLRLSPRAPPPFPV